MAPNANVSLCVILLELSEDSPSEPIITYKAPKYQTAADKEEPSAIEAELKFGNGDNSQTRGLRTPVIFTVETIDMDKLEEKLEDDCGASSAGTATADADGAPKKIHYYSGNSFVEVTKGIIHLYKENERTPLDKTGKTAPSHMLVMLSIPTYISCRDLLQFLAPFKRELDHIKVIRENTPNQYMALLKCKSESSADSVYSVINGTPYSSLEEEICKVAFVSRVESMKSGGEIGLPLLGHTELPTCPVCLERMDESVDGILTILCNHTFHSGCLAKWSDARCPVCRYVQTPEMVAKNMCFECGSSESLWICLICGHIGCGRYVHGHAYKHFCETSHCYAIQPDNNRVWDYAGDNFVHRLLQNKDGKLVEVGNQRRSDECEDSDEKVDHIQLEFTYMLTTQLESQRYFFEESMGNQAKEFRKEIEKLNIKLAEASEKKFEQELSHMTKERNALDRKYNQVNQKLLKVTAELKEETELNKHLQNDQQKWKEMVKKLETDFENYKKEKEAEIKDLKEQLRDIMFYMEAQQKIEESSLKSEIVDGQVTVGEPAESPGTSGRGRRKKKN